MSNRYSSSINIDHLPHNPHFYVQPTTPTQPDHYIPFYDFIIVNCTGYLIDEKYARFMSRILYKMYLKFNFYLYVPSVYRRYYSDL